MSELVDQLASGFGALLEQIQELDKKNTHLEHLLDSMQQQIRDNNLQSTFERTENTLPVSAQHTTKETGLHIECEDNQLHLNNISRNTKWLIADGFKAWSTLRTRGTGRHPHTASLTPKNHQESGNQEQSNATMVKNELPRCPFATLQSTASNPHPPSSSRGSMPSEAYALYNGILKDPIAAGNHAADSSSLPTSLPGSTSKCPIRFLDQHSPEEVAEYFKNHRHEIPRSHEICVKRYQKNEDQIRQLDHKYGSLVSMIQGLGQKHQPLLHTKSGEENVSQTRTSQDIKVEEWAQEIDADEHKLPEVAPIPEENEKGEERIGHFERPLKEIRVGESPSRPWGIPVPLGRHIPASAASHHEKPSFAGSQQPEPLAPPTPTPGHADVKSPLRSGAPTDGQPNMVFTGPVFIGYAPDQIADIIQRTGLGKGQQDV
ncbi:MAG: hypothetical protein Q9171_007247 [Xanthocarpia ochracea]